MGVIEALRTLRSGAMRGLGVGPIELIRARMWTGTPGDRVAEISEMLVALEVTRRTGWRLLTSRAADKSKMDWVFMLGEAICGVQVKGSTFTGGRSPSWAFNTFDPSKGLNKELFALPNFLFAMVLFECDSGTFHSNVALSDIQWRILMVPGSSVIKYFEGDESHSPKSKTNHNITIGLDALEKGKHEWWMGESAGDIEGMFAGERVRPGS